MVTYFFVIPAKAGIQEGKGFGFSRMPVITAKKMPKGPSGGD
jgi:hypothetical protein